MNILEKLDWRYATKKFNPALNVSESKLEILKKAIQFAPTSYGLQPFQVLLVKNPEIREKLQEASWGQTQITESSYVVVFTRKNWESTIPTLLKAKESLIKNLLEMKTIKSIEKQIIYCPAPWGNFKKRAEEWSNKMQIIKNK